MSQSTSTINDLIETLKDGQEGFKSASENVKSPDLKALFSEYALQRAQLSGELQDLARSLGEPEPTDSPSVASTLHRGWINLKSAITSQDDHAILAECERGEDSAVAAFKKALDGTLPANVEAIVARHAAQVKAAHDRVRDLRDSIAS